MSGRVLFEGAKEPSQSSPDYVIYGVPLDMTETYRNGTGEAPAAIRKASVSIESYSPFLDRDLAEFSVCDCGNVELSNTDLEKDLESIERTVAALEVPFCLIGGEHTLTLASFKAVAQKYEDIYLVVADAHTDMREEYEGSRVNHATWLKRVLDFFPPEKVVLAGVRSGTRDEFNIPLLETREDIEIDDKTLTLLERADAVYLSIDIDVLDSPYVPGCGNPEPGGLHYKELEEFVHWLGLNTNLVGFDLVEVAPPLDVSEITSITAARIIRETILASI